MRTKLILILLFFLPLNLLAGEKEILNSVKTFYEQSEYYNAITETLRYQHFYPFGKFRPQILFFRGKSCFKGGDYSSAIDSFLECYQNYPLNYWGEKSLFELGTIRLFKGSPLFALRHFYDYQEKFPQGKFQEEVQAKVCYAAALGLNLDYTLEEIANYKKIFSQGEFLNELDSLEKRVYLEKKRPRKSILTSVLGSVVLPGFGHFYTENYQTGFLALASNLLFGSLAYRGYKKENSFQFYFFGFTEIIFYQYSLVSSINQVVKYNSKEFFYKEVRLSLKTLF